MKRDDTRSQHAHFGNRDLRSRAPRSATGTASAAARDVGGGADPYNTSGGFDRRNNWARVGKR